MRHYSDLDEERIRVQTRVREWVSADLLDISQRARVEADLLVDVKRTNNFLRAGLALFTALIVGASVFLVVTGFDSGGRAPIALAFGLTGVLCAWIAEMLAGRLRFYRFGVEEALAVAAALLVGLAAAELASAEYGLFRSASQIAGLTVAGAGGFVIYRRFGFVYAAIGSMACVALIPFRMDLPPAAKYCLSAATLAVVFLVVRAKRLRYQDDYPGDEYGQLQAAALAGIYIVLNLQLRLDVFDRATPISSGAFYWFTYATIWILPIVALGLAIREKDRVLLDVSLAVALVTLLTNKPYLGWPRHAWDPILLGVLLMAAAIALRRWLSSGPNGRRFGFTSARLLGKDGAVLTVLRAASAAYRPDSGPSVSRGPRENSASPPDFGGGRSGGAGGGGTY